MSVSGVILVRILPAFSGNQTEYREILHISLYSLRMRKNAGKMRTRVTPNTDTFYAVKIGVNFFNTLQKCLYFTNTLQKCTKVAVEKKVSCNFGRKCNFVVPTALSKMQIRFIEFRKL